MFNTSTNKMEKTPHTFATVPKSNSQIEIHSTRIFDRSLPWVCTAINRNWKKTTHFILFIWKHHSRTVRYNYKTNRDTPHKQRKCKQNYSCSILIFTSRSNVRQFKKLYAGKKNILNPFFAFSLALQL